MTKITQDDYRKLDFLYEVMRKKLDVEIGGFNALSNKINYLLSITGVLLAFNATIISQSDTNQGLNVSLQVTGMLGLLCVLLFLLMALRIKTYYDPPHNEYIYSSDSLRKTYFTLKNDVRYKMRDAYLLNQKINIGRENWVKRAYLLLIISICVIIIGIIPIEPIERSIGDIAHHLQSRLNMIFNLDPRNPNQFPGQIPQSPTPGQEPGIPPIWNPSPEPTRSPGEVQQPPPPGDPQGRNRNGWGFKSI